MSIIRKPLFVTGVIGKGTGLPVDGGPGIGDETVIVDPPPSPLVVIEHPFVRIEDYSYDGTTILPLDTTTLFDPYEDQTTGSFTYHKSTYYNGNVILRGVGGNTTLPIYTTSTGETPLTLKRTITGVNNIKMLGITPDKKYAIIMDQGAGAYFLDAITFDEIPNLSMSTKQATAQREAVVNHDSTRYYCPSVNPDALWDCSDPTNWTLIDTPGIPGNLFANAAAFHPVQTSRLLLLYSVSTFIQLYTVDLDNPQDTATLVVDVVGAPFETSALNTHITTDGKYYICKALQNGFFVFDTSDANPTNWTVTYDPFDINPTIVSHDSFTISPNNKRMYFASGEIYDITTMPFTRISGVIDSIPPPIFPALVGVTGDEPI